MLLNTTNNNFLLERNETIQWLNKNRFPSLPVAPQQDPYRYPRKDKNGKIEYEADGKTPKPLYTGKNPSYLDKNGIPHLIQHRKYQDKLPTSQEIKTWFAHPDNGIGTLGGWNKTVWLDFDVKHFNSPHDCKHTILQWLEHNPPLQRTFFELTHSGGFRLGIKVTNQPDFANFALSPGGKHVGEVLSGRRFTVLSPTIGPSGNAYESIIRSELIEVENLESIGIYPSSKRNQLAHVLALQTDFLQAGIPLEKLLSNKAKNILDGDNPTGDRSEALTILAREAFGWENWCSKNKVPIQNNAENIIELAGNKLGIDGDRIQRIIKSINIEYCYPAENYQGGEESCWQKIRKLNKVMFEAQCPSEIKSIIANPTNNSFSSSSSEKITKESQAGVIPKQEAVEKARLIIKSGLPEIDETLQLDELREQSGLSSYLWERKILPSLRRELQPHRLTLEIQNYLLESDIVRQSTERQKIISRYSLSNKDFENHCNLVMFQENHPKGEPRPLPLKEIFEMGGHQMQWLVEGMIPKGVGGVISADPGDGKTLLAIDLSYCIINGTPFLGERVRQGKVLFISTDQPANITAKYLYQRGFDGDDQNFLGVLDTANQPLWTVKNLLKLEEWIENFRPDLVVLDSIRSIIIQPLGLEEKDLKIGHWVKEIERICTRYGGSVLWIHHNNKSRDATGVNRASGSNSIISNTSYHYVLERDNAKDPQDPNRKFHMMKTRGWESVSLHIQFNASTGEWKNQGRVGESPETATKNRTLQQKYLEFFENHRGQGFEVEEIKNLVGGGESAGVILCRMTNRGLISSCRSKTSKKRMIYGLDIDHPSPSTVCVTPVNSNSQIQCG